MLSDEIHKKIERYSGIEPIKARAKKEDGKVKITIIVAQVEIEVSNVN